MSRHADFVISALCLRRQQLLRHFMFMNYFSSTIVKFYSVLDVVSAYLRFFQKNHVFFFFFFSFFKQYETLHEFAWYPCAGPIVSPLCAIRTHGVTSRCWAKFQGQWPDTLQEQGEQEVRVCCKYPKRESTGKTQFTSR